MDKDLEKESLINLVNGLSEFDRKISELEIQKDRIDDTIEVIKTNYNKIIEEITRRFPPLTNDVNLQPKTLKKTR